MKPQCFKSVLNSVLHTPKDFSSLSKWKWPSFERDNHVGWWLGWERGGTTFVVIGSWRWLSVILFVCLHQVKLTLGYRCEVVGIPLATPSPGRRKGKTEGGCGNQWRYDWDAKWSVLWCIKEGFGTGKTLYLSDKHVILYTLSTVSVMAIQAVRVLTRGLWSTSLKEQINKLSKWVTWIRCVISCNLRALSIGGFTAQEAWSLLSDWSTICLQTTFACGLQTQQIHSLR